MVQQETINKTLEFMSELTHEEVIADDKKVLRSFFRGLTNSGLLDSYALDYNKENFRFSLIKGMEERIFIFKTSGTIEDYRGDSSNAT